MNLWTCTFITFDTGSSSVSGLDCPDLVISLPEAAVRYAEFSGTGNFLRLGYQDNDGAYYVDSDFYNMLILLFWLIPISFSIIWKLSAKWYQLGKSK